MSESSTVEVDLSQLREGWNPRRTFDIKGLAADISKRGLLVPLEVRLLETGSYEIVDGARRFRALTYLKVEKGTPQIAENIPVVLVDADENEAAVMKFTRFEFSEGITEADRMQALADRWEFESAGSVTTQEEFADRYGVSRSAVANAIRFVGAPKKVRALVEKGELTPSHVVKAVLKFEDPKDQVSFAEGFVDRRFGHGGGSVRQAIDLADRYLKEQRREAEFARLQNEAEVKVCPQCESPPRTLTSISEAYKVKGAKKSKVGDDLQVFMCSRGSTWNAHHWDPKTGDLIYSSWDADAKVRREQKILARKQDTGTAPGKRKPFALEAAWFFSSATVQEWATALLNEGLEREGQVQVAGSSLTVVHKKGVGPDEAMTIEPVEIDGRFHTRILLPGFRSGARVDNVAPTGLVKDVQKRRKAILAFQKKAIGIDQGTFMPPKSNGFALGQKVMLVKDHRASYNRKKGTILAFDVQGGFGEYRTYEEAVWALLKIGTATKTFLLDALAPVEEKT